MPEPLFYFFSLLTLIFGVGVVINRNPVASALCLVASFIGLAAIYVSLNAYFLGTIQVLVYAGAVMVLFLFIIMLMDIKAEERRKFNLVAVGGGMVLVLGFLAMFSSVVSGLKGGEQRLSQLPLDSTKSDVVEIGKTLFTDYNLHLQIVGVLLLVATVGVVVLSRREDRQPAPNETP